MRQYPAGGVTSCTCVRHALSAHIVGMKKLPAEHGNDTERVREVTIITALCTHYLPTLWA